MGSTKQEDEDASLAELSDIQFKPPLYEQRYQEIVRIVNECKPKKVVDIGCGELSVIRLLKFHESLHELIGLDIDVDVFQQRLFLIQPLPACYLTPRPHPFSITLLQGSIAERDARLLGCDLAVCVEVIEHLYPDDLAKATEVIFGYMQPTRAIFTTPNAEFNVLFPGFQGFRHDDHKFEWTREEFQEWGNAVCMKFGYTVEYSGLGVGPAGTEHLGCCTQTALFQRKHQSVNRDSELDNESGVPWVYHEIAREEYPFRLADGDRSKEILSEVQFRIRQLLSDARLYLDEEDGQFDDSSEDGAEANGEIDKWIKEHLSSWVDGSKTDGDSGSTRCHHLDSLSGGREEGESPHGKTSERLTSGVERTVCRTCDGDDANEDQSNIIRGDNECHHTPEEVQGDGDRQRVTDRSECCRRKNKGSQCGSEKEDPRTSVGIVRNGLEGIDKHTECRLPTSCSVEKDKYECSDQNKQTILEFRNGNTDSCEKCNIQNCDNSSCKCFQESKRSTLLTTAESILTTITSLTLESHTEDLQQNNDAQGAITTLSLGSSAKESCLANGISANDIEQRENRKLEDCSYAQAATADHIVDIANCPLGCTATSVKTVEKGRPQTAMDHHIVDIAESPSDYSSILVCPRTGIIDIGECATFLRNEAKNFLPSRTHVESGMTFYSQWEKGFVVDRDYVVDELKVRIPFSRLLMYPSIQKLCADINNFRDVIVSSGKFILDEDRTAIVCELYEESEICSSLEDFESVDGGDDQNHDFQIEDWEEESWD